MGNNHRRKAKGIQGCPQCGSSFVDWDPKLSRFRCLERDCSWQEASESKPGEYNYATGTSWSPSPTDRPKLF